MMLIRALTDDSEKIYVCRNPHTLRWITLQRGHAIADTEHPKEALAVARAEAQKLPKKMNRNANDVVEEVGCGSHAPGCSSGDGDGGLRRPLAQ